jgi:hypothetical protein
LKRKFHDRLLRSTGPPDTVIKEGIRFGPADLEASFKRLHPPKEKTFLGFFNESMIESLIARINLAAQLESMGFGDIRVAIHIDENDINYLDLYHKKPDPDRLLLELRLSQSKYSPDPTFFDDGFQTSYDMIVIEWLSAQDPVHDFSADRPQLPGQRRPGLGILKKCFEMMKVMAKEVRTDGFLDIPDHIHGAIMYAKRFKFFDPAHEGVLRALMRDLQDYSLSDISWGILTQTIFEEYSNLPQPYDPSEQVFYLSDRLAGYFHAARYRKIFKRYYKRKHFRFEYEEMREKRENILMKKKIEDL